MGGGVLNTGYGCGWSTDSARAGLLKWQPSRRTPDELSEDDVSDGVILSHGGDKVADVAVELRTGSAPNFFYAKNNQMFVTDHNLQPRLNPRLNHLAYRDGCWVLWLTAINAWFRPQGWMLKGCLCRPERTLETAKRNNKMFAYLRILWLRVNQLSQRPPPVAVDPSAQFLLLHEKRPRFCLVWVCSLKIML